MEANFSRERTILVIEDDPIMLKAISNILNKGGYTVYLAKDAKEAFELMETINYDIVVTDLMLPYANGLEVVRRIRKDYSKKNVGIIVVSSMGHEEVVIEAYGLGVDIYLKKPIMAAELLSRIRKLLTEKNIYGNSIKAPRQEVRAMEVNAPVYAHMPALGLYADSMPRNSGNNLHIRKYHIEK